MKNMVSLGWNQDVFMVLKVITPGISSHRKCSPQSVHGGHRTLFSVHPFQPSQLPWRELFVDVTDEKPNDTERNRKWGKTQKIIVFYLENIPKVTYGLDIFADSNVWMFAAAHCERCYCCYGNDSQANVSSRLTLPWIKAQVHKIHSVTLIPELEHFDSCCTTKSTETIRHRCQPSLNWSRNAVSSLLQRSEPFRSITEDEETLCKAEN